jgi:hypothetical protein
LHDGSLTTNAREWTRRNVSDSRPLVSIRGSFFRPFAPLLLDLVVTRSPRRKSF